MRYLIFLLVFLFVPALPSFTKDIKSACSLVTAAQLSKITGYDLKVQPDSKGKRCHYQSDNNFIKVWVEYIAYKDAETAFKALKKERADNVALIKKGQKVENAYNVLGAIPEGKPDDYYMTGDGNVSEGPNAVSYRFMFNRYVIVFTTRGVMKTLIVPKLGEVYNTILRNAGWKF